ncbi:MAG: alpha/beta hydrolase [Solirubrobacterales bacterium]
MLEILRAGETNPKRPPLLFVHGAFSGAWIWAEHFLPFFAAAGWECAAVSLRGHGESSGRDRLDHCGLADYVDDVAEAAATLGRPPVVIGYSMGGAVAQRFVTSRASAGLVLLASAPPTGMAGPTWWMTLHRPRFTWQLAVLEAAGAASVDPEILSQNLFSPETPSAQALRYLPFLQRESRRATMEVMLPQPVHRPRPGYPVLVVGGDDDAFIPVAALQATAAFWQARLTVVPGLPHLAMLDARWRRAATAIADWVADLP